MYYRSVSHRTIKLFFIGNGESGKTTLFRRLSSLPNETPERTTGIDIEEWVYPPRGFGSRIRSQRAKDPVKFLSWDFAGQVSVTYLFLQECYICIDNHT